MSITREPMPYGKVLIVDDMKSNLDVAKLLLEPYELQIDTATSGYEAIDKIKAGKEYDIVFMDHMMPRMDGMEAAKELRNIGYNQPIIALTANAVTGQQEIFLANGFNGYISKPIDLRQMNDSLNKFIRDKARNKKNSDAGSLVDIKKNDSGAPADTKTRAENISEIAIPGINVKKGRALYDDNADIYLSVLRSFVPNALSNIEKLHTVSAETLSDYAITVHGMKGISANIGADTLREAALNLELLAKSGDLTGVLAKNEAFLREAEKVVSDVQSWLKKWDGENQKPRIERPDKILLKRLYNYCENYDMKGIDDIMDQIESVCYDTDASLVTWLREKINESDFPLVSQRLLEYIGETQ